MADKRNSVYSEAGTYVAIVDILGYTDKDGDLQYEPRGTEVELSASEAARLSVLDPANHVFPAIAPPESHAAVALSEPFSSQTDPVQAAARLLAIHETEAPLQTPAGEATDTVPSEEAPADPDAAPAVDYDSWVKKDLKAELDKRKIEYDSKAKNAEMIKLLQVYDAANAGDSDVTARVGSPS